MRASFVGASLALVLSACGPEKGDDGGSSSAEATTHATTDGPGETGGTGGTGGSDAATDAPTTAGPDCSQYADEALGPTVEITIRHDGDEPVWLPAGGCSGQPEVHVLDAMNTDYFFAGGGGCGSRRCVDLLAAESCEIACEPCASPTLVRVDPGATIVLIWSAVIAEELTMTAECAPGIDCAGPCQRLRPVPEGPYTIELPAFLGCTGECTCDPPDPNNFCSLFGVAEGAEPTKFSVTIDYSAETAALLVIP